MPNPFRGEVELQVGDDTYKLVLDVNAFCAIEPLLRMRPLQIAQAFTDEPDGMVVPRALLWGALQKHHEMTVWDAGELMGEAGPVAVRSALTEAMAAMFGMEKAAEGKKPGNPRQKTRGTG